MAAGQPLFDHRVAGVWPSGDRTFTPVCEITPGGRSADQWIVPGRLAILHDLNVNLGVVRALEFLIHPCEARTKIGPVGRCAGAGSGRLMSVVDRGGWRVVIRPKAFETVAKPVRASLSATNRFGAGEKARHVQRPSSGF